MFTSPSTNEIRHLFPKVLLNVVPISMGEACVVWNRPAPPCTIRPKVIGHYLFTGWPPVSFAELHGYKRPTNSPTHTHKTTPKPQTQPPTPMLYIANAVMTCRDDVVASLVLALSLPPSPR